MCVVLGKLHKRIVKCKKKTITEQMEIERNGKGYALFNHNHLDRNSIHDCWQKQWSRTPPQSHIYKWQQYKWNATQQQQQKMLLNNKYKMFLFSFCNKCSTILGHYLCIKYLMMEIFFGMKISTWYWKSTLYREISWQHMGSGLLISTVA